MKTFVEKFHKEYQEITRFYIPNNELNIIQLAEVCDHYSFAIGNSYNISKADLIFNILDTYDFEQYIATRFNIITTPVEYNIWIRKN